MKRISSLLLALMMTLGLTACADQFGVTIITTPGAAQSQEMGSDASVLPDESAPDSADASQSEDFLPTEGGYYYDLENVVLYLEAYGTLPDNYITKDEARQLGWEGGSVEKYLEGAAIGGDSFGNREGLLPREEGRSYTECDLYTIGEDSRGAERLVFSDDGLYFYTQDHYESFTQYVVTQDWEVVPA